MIRFLHSSDLHLGKRFGRFPEEVRHRLRQARQDSISRLAEAARAGGATHVLLAGDTFDAETPQRATLRQSMNAMASAPDLCWVLMPGNHDHLGAAEIWDVLAREHPQNVVLALEPVPMGLGEGAMLLPAPSTARAPGRDLTEWMDSAETGTAIRVGLAHGSIRDFSSAEEIGSDSNAVIPPDRAQRAKLDYLGIGDWHGRIEVTPNTWYSGTPEPDSFKPHRPAGALLVSIVQPGGIPEVTEVETGQIGWMRLVIDVLETEDPTGLLSAALPPLPLRDRTMLEVRATGRAELSAFAALSKALDCAAPDFLWAEGDLAGLAVSYDVTDLSQINARGAVRDAAETLAEAAQAGDELSAAALRRLYAYALEVQ